MKLHTSVVDKLLYLYQTYGGFADESKLRKFLEEMDLTPYERKTGSQEMILVLTEEFVKQLSTKRGR